MLKITDSLPIFLLVLSLNCFSQTIERSVFANTGSFANNGTLSLQSNIGELQVVTYINPSNIFSQGFVQPDPLVATFISSSDNVIKGKVSPNPVSDKLFLELEAYSKNELVIEVFNLLGEKQMVSSLKTNTNNLEIFELNVENLQSGIYFVRISSQYYSDKIFKINKI